MSHVIVLRSSDGNPKGWFFINDHFMGFMQISTWLIFFCLYINFHSWSQLQRVCPWIFYRFNLGMDHFMVCLKNINSDFCRGRNTRSTPYEQKEYKNYFFHDGPLKINVPLYYYTRLNWVLSKKS